MRMINALATLSVLGFAAGTSLAATSLSVSHDTSDAGFNGQLSSSDLAQGLIAVEKVTGDGNYPSLEYVDGLGIPVNDNGWHPANPASGDSMFPLGLPTLTNGLGVQHIYDGLLNDFPGDGKPTKRLVYDLGGSFDIGQINILGGNTNNADGRAFITAIIRVSTDGGTTWTDLDGNGGTVIYDGKAYTDSSAVEQDANPFAIPNGSYFQSDASGTVNDSQGNNWKSTFMQITDDASPILAAGVTHVNIEFYAVHHNDNVIEDPFFGVNPFTGVDDNTLPAPADFNEDGIVDLLDYNILALNYGTASGATGATGDASGDGAVNDDDLLILKGSFGSTGALRMSNEDDPWPITSPEIWEIDILEAVVPAVVPEPATAMLLSVVGLGLLRRRS